MDPLLTPPANDDDSQDEPQILKAKKETVIQPPSATTPIPEAPDLPGANTDLLAELRAKTAELAKSVRGDEQDTERVLELEEETDPEAMLKALESKGLDEKRLDTTEHHSKSNPAIEIIRQKLSKIYIKEPDAEDEAIEAYQAGTERTKHQQFMYDLTTSGKSLAAIQTEWHKYYVNLPDNEKHQVWDEFYETQKRTSHYALALGQHDNGGNESNKISEGTDKKSPARKPHEPQTVGGIKSKLLDKVSAGGKLNAVHHAKSLLFGLGLATFVGLIITFTFFNEVFIAPFISPSRTVSATPIIGAQTGKVGPEPKIIIPKINLEVPVVFDLGTVEEKAIQAALENGVVHYSSTPNPGEKGNIAIVGHSSNNILNSGKYKFAFVLLKRLEAEDTFFIQNKGIRYTYKVYKKEIVSPNEVSVLQTQEKPNTVTLITCDPPGTSLNRLVVTAEQISPDPKGNKKSSAPELDTNNLVQLPSNAPSLWSRIWPF